MDVNNQVPYKVEIEAEGKDWNRSYLEYITVRLDEEETKVRVELQTIANSSVGSSPIKVGKSIILVICVILLFFGHNAITDTIFGHHGTYAPSVISSTSPVVTSNSENNFKTADTRNRGNTNEYWDNSIASCTPGSASARCSSSDSCVDCGGNCVASGTNSGNDLVCDQGKWKKRISVEEEKSQKANSIAVTGTELHVTRRQVSPAAITGVNAFEPTQIPAHDDGRVKEEKSQKAISIAVTGKELHVTRRQVSPAAITGGSAYRAS